MTAGRIRDAAFAVCFVAGLMMWTGLVAYTPLLPDWWTVFAPLGGAVASVGVPTLIVADMLATRGVR